MKNQMWYNVTVNLQGEGLRYVQFIEYGLNDQITMLIFSDNYLNAWLQLDSRQLQLLEAYLKEKGIFEIMYSWQDLNYSGQLITIDKYMIIEVSPQKPVGYTINVGKN
jgi:hypothetical protein